MKVWANKKYKYRKKLTYEMIEKDELSTFYEMGVSFCKNKKISVGVYLGKNIVFPTIEKPLNFLFTDKDKVTLLESVLVEESKEHGFVTYEIEVPKSWRKRKEINLYVYYNKHKKRKKNG